MLLNKDDVLTFLPHRDPFLFIDSVEELIVPQELTEQTPPYKMNQMVGGKSVCHFKVRKELTVLEGHFPGNPILPGVVQVEMMAQASSFLVLKVTDEPLEKIKLEVALMGVDRAKFRKPIVPEMDLVINATLVKIRGPVMAYDCEIIHQGEVMSECHVLASLKFV